VLLAPGEVALQIWGDLRADRLRFLLTVLSLAIGALSIVVLCALVLSTRQFAVAGTQQAIGGDVVRIVAQPAPPGRERRARRPLETTDVAALADSPSLPGVQVSAGREVYEEIRWGRRRRTVRIAAGDPDLARVHRLTLGRGRFLSESDLRQRRRVAVVGARVWAEVLERAARLDGLEIRTAEDRFDVIGVLAEKPDVGPQGPWGWDEKIIVPATTFELTFPANPAARRDVSEILVRLPTEDDLEKAAEAVGTLASALLLRRHLGVQSFRVADTRGDPRTRLVGLVVFVLLLSTGVLAFLVGGVNNLNMMLVSVAQRTREVGIRRALGASRAAVLLQFLAEAVVVALLGGASGALTGAALSWVGSLLIGTFISDWTLVLPARAVYGPIVVALAVGAVFGLYPAWRAACLDPCAALRQE
jgi:putative ABC transport system permease protein